LFVSSIQHLGVFDFLTYNLGYVCLNHLEERYVLHPHTEVRRIDSEIGFGVFANALIPKGTITWCRDELELSFSQERLNKMTKFYQDLVVHFCFRDAGGNYVLCWDFARYMNHSCDCNVTCIGTLCDIAKRDIKPGEQLTCDYSLHNLPDDFTCSCGAPQCRDVIRAADLPKLIPAIDAKVKDVVAIMSKVPQPVFEMMLPGDLKRVQDIIAGREKIPSAVENFRPLPP